MGNCLNPAKMNNNLAQHIGSTNSGGISKTGASSSSMEEEILSSPNLRAFSFEELNKETNNFSNENLIGVGRFGNVYMGRIDIRTCTASKSCSKSVVAITKLDKHKLFQGQKQWLAEVEFHGRLLHRNLVKLIGYCLDGENRLLVYQFMRKGSLENHLLKRGEKPLQWSVRMKVAIGSARGLSFLHSAESHVILGNFKTSNILLDAEFNAKLTYFRQAKDSPWDDSHESIQVMGTHGYEAPEYVATGIFNAKSDVYSFGVVLLELMTGRRAYDRSRAIAEQYLVEWAKPYLSDKQKLFQIMDPKLRGQYPQNAAYKVADLALQCLKLEAKARPSMADVLATLEQINEVIRNNVCNNDNNIAS